jgi:hypothetical protein
VKVRSVENWRQCWCYCDEIFDGYKLDITGMLSIIQHPSASKDLDLQSTILGASRRKATGDRKREASDHSSVRAATRKTKNCVSYFYLLSSLVVLSLSS